MAEYAIKWDQLGEREYRTGVDHGVIYPQKNGAYPEGFGWSGLTTVTQRPSGAENNAVYADNMKYLNLKSAEDFGITIECLTYPPEFEPCNGVGNYSVPGVKLSQQRRNTFGFSWRTLIGNDTEGTNHGYEIHIVYNCSATPSELANNTVNDSPEAGTLSFECETTSLQIPGKDADGNDFQPTSHIYFDSRLMSKEQLEKLEKILYGTPGDGTEGSEIKPRLPLPEEFPEIFAEG